MNRISSLAGLPKVFPTKPHQQKHTHQIQLQFSLNFSQHFLQGFPLREYIDKSNEERDNTHEKPKRRSGFAQTRLFPQILNPTLSFESLHIPLQSTVMHIGQSYRHRNATTMAANIGTHQTKLNTERDRGVNNTISQRRFHQAHDESHWQWRGPSSELSADSPSQPRRSAASLNRARAGAEPWRLAKMIVFVLPVYVSECAPLTCTRHLRAGRGTVSFGN